MAIIKSHLLDLVCGALRNTDVAGQSSQSMSTAYSSKRAITGKSEGWSEEMSIREERGARTKSILTYQPVPSISVGRWVWKRVMWILLSGGLAMTSSRYGPWSLSLYLLSVTDQSRRRYEYFQRLAMA